MTASIPAGVEECLAAGLALIPIPYGRKGPKGEEMIGWNRREFAVTGLARASDFSGMNAGLAHAWSRTCALDVDDMDRTEALLAADEIDLTALFCADQTVQVRSPRPNRGKLLYRLPADVEPLQTVKINGEDGHSIYELRCADAGALTVQDVIAGAHPDGGQYELRGDPARMPEIPAPLLALWRRLTPATGTHGAGARVGSGPIKYATEDDAPPVYVTPKQVAELRSALNAIPADDYKVWTDVGAALHELGNVGLELWRTWSQSCPEKYDPATITKKWRQLKHDRTGYQAVFKRAQDYYGWVNPGSNDAQLRAPGADGTGAPTNDAGAYRADPGPPEEPQNLFEVQDPPALDVAAALPAVLSDFALAHASVAGHDPTAYAYCAIAAAASVLPHATRLVLSPSWSEPLVQWVALVGPSGSGKTPAMSAAVGPIEALHLAGERMHQAECAARKQDKDAGEPPRRSGYYFTDCTIEALLDRAANASHTVLRFADEGTAWLNAMGRYAIADSGERGIWLAGWNGKPYTVARMGRGDSTLPAWSVGLLYGITPARLKEAYEDAAADGMLARTLICMTSAQRWVPVKAVPDIVAIRERYDTAIRTAASGARALTLSTQAERQWAALRLEYRDTAQATAEMAPGLSAFLFKAPTMAARLAGLFATLEGAAIVTEGSMQRAERFMRHATATAYIAHQQVFAVAQPVGIARRLATKILTSAGARVTRREFSKVDAFAKASTADQGAAINHLAAAAWLTAADGKRERLGPRFHEATAWRVNPLVHKRFADIAERERQAAAHATAKLGRLLGRVA